MNTINTIDILSNNKWFERVSKVQPLVSDTVKQLITLSSGLLTLMIALSKDILKPELSSIPKLLVVIAWSFFVASSLFGIKVLNGLSICLDPKVSTESLWKDGVLRPFKWQGHAFLFALFFTLLYGVLAVFPALLWF